MFTEWNFDSSNSTGPTPSQLRQIDILPHDFHSEDGAVFLDWTTVGGSFQLLLEGAVRPSTAATLPRWPLCIHLVSTSSCPPASSQYNKQNVIFSPHPALPYEQIFHCLSLDMVEDPGNSLTTTSWAFVAQTPAQPSCILDTQKLWDEQLLFVALKATRPVAFSNRVIDNWCNISFKPAYKFEVPASEASSNSKMWSHFVDEKDEANYQFSS